MEEYKKFITQFRCKSGEAYSHTSIDEPKGSFKIPEDKLNQFYDIYTRAMVQGVKLYLTEKPIDPSPMRLDLDFRFAMDEPRTTPINRKYTIEHVKTIVEAYNSILAKYIESPVKFTAYVMEKTKPTEHRGKIKDGIHIIWPHLIVSHSLQHLIRKHMLDDATNLFNGLNICNPYEDIIDQAIIDKNNWQMYGSRKPDCEAYRVTHIYEYDKENMIANDIGMPSATDELTFPRLFSMRDKESLKVTLIPEKEAELEEYIRHILPSMDERRKTKLHKQVFGKCNNNAKNLINDDDLNMARMLVADCLLPSRADNYEEWVKLGWTLRNIDYRLLESWIEFSRVSNKYIEGECQNLWNKMKNDTLGMGTLRWWARNDNPKEYENILKNNVEILIDKCIGSDGAHYDVAMVVHALFKDRYRFTSKDSWYTFVEHKHRWVHTREGLKLRMVLSNDICTRFLKRAVYWTDKARVGDDEVEREKYNEKSKKLGQIAIRLKTAGYKDSVMKECKGLFTDEKFEEVLDSHPYLIGFENGVYDLRMAEFRDGLPDDYISFNTGRNYCDYDPQSIEAREINSYLAQVFTNEPVREYMKDIMACMIDGGIRQEKFYIYTGSGCHAKDTEIMLYNGKKKLVQDITESDILMGDDSTPRNIVKLFRGNSKMYKICPIKGDSFVVNEDHKISLKVSLSSCPRVTTNNNEYRVKWVELIFKTEEDGCIAVGKEKCFKTKYESDKYLNELKNNDKILQLDDVIDVQVKNYINFNMYNLKLYLFKVKVDYKEQEVTLDPYILGCWLGDGHSRITTMDPEIVDNLIMNKHIPDVFKINSREIRLKVLAGILDTDGTYQKHTNQYILTLKSEKLIDDTIDLVRSLGFVCYKKAIKSKCGDYFTINIVGKGIEDIPCLLPRKKASPRIKEKDPLLNSFKIERVEDDDYYGFEVSNNHRYLMGDFTVTCNSNSKSALLNLVQKAIGDYYCILPIALLTQKRAASNSAQSELERTKGRRIAVMQEPGESEKLNIGLMKELSGGDRIMARGLFKEPIEFRPQFKMIMTCNELPEVPSDDGGTWRRIRVIEYTSKFTDNPDPNNPREFPLDPELLDKFERWADVFISMLIARHKNLDVQTINEPVEVRHATEGYKKNNDVIGQYVGDRIEKDETSTQKVMLAKMYSDFRSWAHQVIVKGKKVPDRNQFKAYLEKSFGVYPKDGKGWRGLKYKSIADDADSDIE
jgi:P4 family phage/plasmid primase-like protien